MKKILILGSNGFLTSNLKHRFTNSNIIKYAGSKNGDFKFSAFDDSINDIICENDFDIILNTIAYTNIDLCEQNKELAFKLNSEFPRILMKAVKKNKKKLKLIHISTDHFYDNDQPSKESDILINNYYSESKMLGERILLDFDSTILRTNFIGKSIHNDKKSLTDWIYNNLENNIKFNAFNDIYFSPLSFNTLTKIIEYLFNNLNYGLFNLGSRGYISKYALAYKFSKTLNKSHLIINSTSQNQFKVKRSKNMIMDSSFFEKTFNYKIPNIENEIEFVFNEYLTT